MITVLQDLDLWRRRGPLGFAEVMGRPDKPGDDDQMGDDRVINLARAVRGPVTHSRCAAVSDTRPG